MSLLTLKKMNKQPAKVHYLQYIKTENKPDEESTTPPKPDKSPKPDAQ